MVGSCRYGRLRTFQQPLLIAADTHDVLDFYRTVLESAAVNRGRGWCNATMVSRRARWTRIVWPLALR
jgi:hypothetical protein